MPLSGDTRKPAGFWYQTWLLFQKNWRTKKRQETSKVLGEICIPIIYLAILSLLVGFQVKVQRYPAQLDDTSANILENTGFPHSSKRHKSDVITSPLSVHVVPDDDFAQHFTHGLMQSLWRNQTSGSRSLKFTFHATVKDLDRLYTNTSGADVDLALILPPWKPGQSFQYTIRVNPNLRVPTPSEKVAQLSTCRGRTNPKDKTMESPITCPVNAYFYSDFLALQSLVDQAVLRINNISHANARLEVTLENFPKTEFQEGLPIAMRILIPLYSVIPLAQLINNLLILIVTEKENKVKDGLRMVGVSDGAYWLSWLGIYGLIVFILSVAFTGIYHYLNVLRHVAPSILFLLFFLFGVSVVTLAFALTPFFHKPKTAGLVGTLVLQLAGVLFLVQTFVEGTQRSLIPFKLISSVAFTVAVDDAAKYEYAGGISWPDLWFGKRGEGILTSLIFLIVDIILYCFVAFYLDNVLPNEFGVRKHPLFFLQPSYWVGFSKDSRQEESFFRDQYDERHDGSSVEDNCEAVPLNIRGKEAIRIRNIRKTYKGLFSNTSVDAVKGITLDIYDGQITAILGRNGAGKSTLFNILTGLVSPSSGTATVFGLDTRRAYDQAKLRKIVGVCLQQDLHFPSLTAEEHLIFYGKLRGMNKDELTSETTKILHELKLYDSRNLSVEKLSGGQRRKLSVGIALIGDPTVVLLDEPSAGLDPVSRRSLWTLLQQKKEGKVILLTTHFMDEADVLADRKAIVHDGVLRCVGSSLFLKNKFGVGYLLTVELSSQATSTATCDDIVEKWVPESVATRKLVAQEVKYSLPHSEASKFAALFSELEDEITDGDSIQSFGVSMTTLEDVFLKISSGLDVEDKVSRLEAETEEVDMIKETGILNPNWITTLWALILLRVRRLIRSPQSMFFMLVMPLIFTAGGFTMASVKLDTTKSLTLSDPASIYPEEDFQIAVNENGSDFMDFLLEQKIRATTYSGVFSDLLSLNSSAAAVNIVKSNFSDDEQILSALMRVNGTFLHSPPLVLRLLANYFSSKVQGKISPEVIVQYEPFTTKVALAQTSVFSVFLIGPAFAFCCVGMVMEIVTDRERKTRNHLRVNGVSVEMYFLSIFIVFGLIQLLLVISQLVLIAVFQVEAFMNPFAILIVSGTLVLHILPSQIFGAFFSYFFNRMETAQTVYSQVATWSGQTVAFVVVIIDIVGVNPLIVRAIHVAMCALNVFYIPYAIFYWVIKVYMNAKIRAIITTEDENVRFGDYWTFEIACIPICMFVQIPAFLLMLLVVDVLKNGGKPAKALKCLLHLHNPSLVQLGEDSHEDEEPEDSDVAEEKSRVIRYFSGLEQNIDCIVAVKNLRKQYKRKKKTESVLNGVNLMLEKGEVFGLLGHNGAGKTTTIKMITAEDAPDSGKVCLCGYDVYSNVSEAFRYLGFCPQHDALWENITLREHIELYARIRGVTMNNMDKLISHFLKGLSIDIHADKHADKLSGGTKRKLSYAMAMLGAPRIVLLDEPSTGMDPQSKRFLWNTILGTFKESRGALLTTHSMEEADILCSRIGIMVKGVILCVGSPQHLKNKFGTGYTMEIKLRKEADSSEEQNPTEERSPRRAAAAHRLSCSAASSQDASPELVPREFRFVVEHFPNCRLVEAFGNRAVFSLPNDKIQSVSRTFSLLEKLKGTHDIEEYAFSQTTLEQVFLSFAKYNEDKEDN